MILLRNSQVNVKKYLVKSCNRSLVIKKLWVAEGIMKSITIKNKMYGELKNSPSM